MRLPAPIAAFLILALALPATAVTPVSVKEYAANRRKHAAVSVKTALADPGACVGKVLEIRGRVAGTSKGNSGSSLILCARDGDSYLVEVDSMPDDDPGVELACLVKVGPGSTHGLSDLKLLCCTYEVDLARVDEAAKRAQEAAAAKLAAREAAKAEAKTKTPQATAKPTRTTGTLTANELIRAYRNAIKGFNKRLTDGEADTIARSVLGFSYKYGVDARLVCAVILAESHFRVGATSGCGAMGLGQLMPTTAAGLGVNDAYDPVENVYGSVRYIKSMLDRMSGSKHWNELTWDDLALALAAYNAGPGAVRKHGGIPPYRETQNYVRRVTSIYKQLCGVGKK